MGGELVGRGRTSCARAHRRSARVGGLIVGLLAATLPSAPTRVGADGPAAADQVPAGATTFVARAPCRLADTRDPADDHRSVDPTTVRVQVLGRCGVQGASAVAVTITVVRAEAPGFVTAGPAGVARPLFAVGTFARDEIRATSTVVQLGLDGAIDVHVSARAGLVVDVTGGFEAADAGAASGRFVPVEPHRLLDTRESSPVGPGDVVHVPLPAGTPDDVVALAVNVTLVGTSAAGWAVLFPAGSSAPATSNVNADGPGQVRSNLSFVPVSPAGLSVVASMTTDVVLDVFGWFTGPSSGSGPDGLFVPAPQVRLLDTREPSPLGAGVPLHPGGGVEIPVPASGTALLMVSAVDATAGHLRAHPAGGDVPATATVAMAGPRETVTNLAVARSSERGVGLTSHGRTHLVVDLVGSFTGDRLASWLPPPLNVEPPPQLLPRGTSGCTALVDITAPEPDAQRIGTSVEGRPILLETYGDPDGRPVLVVGPVHGNECTPLIVVERLRALGRAGALPAGVRVHLVPTLNPDGLVHGTRRNARDVDLNRDGDAVSQPESRALMELTARLQPVVSYHLHSPLTTVGGQGGGGLGVRMAAIIAAWTQLQLQPSAGTAHPFLWLGQHRVAPSMATVLVETPRMDPFEAAQVIAPLPSGPPAGDELWDRVVLGIVDTFRLLA